MKPTLRLLTGIALVALAAAACDNALDSSKRERIARVPGGPALSVGPTASVVVVCPSKLQVDATGNCWAYGVDSLGFKVSLASSPEWTSSSNSILIVDAAGSFIATGAGTATVTAEIDEITASASVPVYTKVDPTVSLSGTTFVAPNTSCTWTATASGGSSPYTYSWQVTSGSPTGSASGNTWTGSGTGSFTLKVTLTDASGRKATAVRGVTVLSGAPSTC